MLFVGQGTFDSRCFEGGMSFQSGDRIDGNALCGQRHPAVRQHLAHGSTIEAVYSPLFPPYDKSRLVHLVVDVVSGENGEY